MPSEEPFSKRDLVTVGPGFDIGVEDEAGEAILQQENKERVPEEGRMDRSSDTIGKLRVMAGRPGCPRRWSTVGDKAASRWFQ